MTDRRIIKYQLEDISDRTGYYSCTRVDIPKGGKIIDISYETGVIYLHTIANPNHRNKERWFSIFEERMPMEEYAKKTCEYIGRVGVNPELYVFEVHD
jgi:hypothetical protein